MRTTRAEVAKLAGVSPSVVSYVLNGGPRNVAPETRRRVEEAIASLEYRPNAIAQALRGGRSGAIGVIVGAGQEHLFRATSLALQKAALSFGYATYVSFASDRSTEQQYARSLADRQVDALIAIQLAEPNALDDLHENGLPVAYIGEQTPPPSMLGLDTNPSTPNRDLLVAVAATNASIVAYSSRLAPHLAHDAIADTFDDDARLLPLDLNTITGGGELIDTLSRNRAVTVMCATDGELHRALWLIGSAGVDATTHTFTTSRVDLRDLGYAEANIAVAWDLERPLISIFDGLLRMIDNPGSVTGPVTLPWRIASRSDAPVLAARIWNVEDM